MVPLVVRLACRRPIPHAARGLTAVLARLDQRAGWSIETPDRRRRGKILGCDSDQAGVGELITRPEGPAVRRFALFFLP
jgi:hypothetical protein